MFIVLLGDIRSVSTCNHLFRFVTKLTDIPTEVDEDEETVKLRLIIALYCSTVQYSTKPYGTVWQDRGQYPFYILPRSKIQILLRTVWEETRGAQRPESPPKPSSVKFGFCSEVKYKLNSTRPLGRVTVQWAYNEPLWGELYVIWMLSPVQSQLSHTDYMVCNRPSMTKKPPVCTLSSQLCKVYLARIVSPQMS